MGGTGGECGCSLWRGLRRVSLPPGSLNHREWTLPGSRFPCQQRPHLSPWAADGCRSSSGTLGLQVVFKCLPPDFQLLIAAEGR